MVMKMVCAKVSPTRPTAFFKRTVLVRVNASRNVHFIHFSPMVVVEYYLAKYSIDLSTCYTVFMNETPRDLSPADKKRVGYIEGREDLFETKVLRIMNEGAEAPRSSILIAARNPGSATALTPV